MLHEIIIAGFGGQGVLSMGQLMAYAGMMEGRHVAWIPSYGPEMRGGTANCGVTISDSPISCPVVTNPTCAIVLNNPSLVKFAPLVKPGGLLLVDSTLVDEKSERTDITAYYIPASQIADELGNARIANIVLLGAFITLTGALQPESVLAALKKVLPERRHHLIPLNEKALQAGIDYIRRVVAVC